MKIVKEISVGLRHLGFLCTAATLVLACSDDRSASSHLLVGTPPSAAPLSPEDEWLHKLQMVTVTTGSGDTAATSSIDPAVFDADVETECKHKVQLPSIGSGLWNLFVNADCRSALVNVEEELCKAKILLAAATVQASPIVLAQAGYGVPQQSEETAEALAEEAAVAAAQARADAFHAVDARGDLFGLPGSGACSARSGSGISLLLPPVATAAYAEAYQTMKDAYDRAVEATINVSDKMRSSSASQSTAAARAVSGSKLSRAAAAHLLVGGDPGVEDNRVGAPTPGSTTQPLCIPDDLSPSAKTALQILRDAAVDPADVVNDGSDGVDIDVLVDGPLASGSVRERLAQFYNYSELSLSTQTVAQFYKLNQGDFQAARAHLKEELLAYGRVSVAQLDPPNGALATGFRRFAGTATEPTDLPPAAWSARGRFTHLYATPPTTPTAPTLLNLAEQIGGVHFDNLTLLAEQWTLFDSESTTDPTDGATNRAKAIAPIAMLEAAHESEGWLFFLNYGTGFGLYAEVHEHRAAERLRIVVGEEGLRCAVQGSIDGASCDDGSGPAPAFPCNRNGAPPSLECLTVLKFNNPDQTQNYRDVWTPYVSAYRPGGDSLPLHTHLYLVKPHDAGSPELPGHFDVVTGFSPATGATQISIVPGVERRVGQALAPSKKNCALPAVSCTGGPVDARLPLEDELADASGGTEESWKHYLDLARTAATDADTLGQDYISTAINLNSVQAEAEIREEEQQQRAEDLLQQVQSDCGTAVDSKKLLSLITGGDGVTIQSPPPVPCGVTADCGANSGKACVGGQCLVSFAELAKSHPKDPDLKALADCLDTTQVFPFVTLGDQDLCVWSTSTNPNDVCPASSNECPSVARPASDPGSLGQPRCPPNPSHGNDPGSLATALHYFHPDTSPPDQTPPNTCEALRILRAHPGDGAATQALIGNGLLDPVHVAAAIGTISWLPKYGGFVDVSFDDKVRATTGAVAKDVGPSALWPCSASVGACNVAMGSPSKKGLFCDFVDCGNDSQRAQMNDRLLRAVVAGGVMLAHTTDTGWALPNSAWLPGDDNAFFNYGASGVKPLQVTGIAVNRSDLFSAGLGGLGVAFPITRGTPVFDYRTGSPIVATAGTEYSGFFPPPNDSIADVYWVQWNRDSSGAGVARPERASSNDIVQFVDCFHDNQICNELFWNGPTPKTSSVDYFWGGIHPASADGRLKKVLAGQVNVNDPHLALTFNMPETELAGQLDGDSYLDGLELLCDATLSKDGGNSDTVPNIKTFEDLDQAGAYLKQLASKLTAQASRLTFAKIPMVATSVGGSTGVDTGFGAFPALNGKMAEQVTTLRDALLQVQNAVPAIAGEMNQFGAELQSERALLQKSGLLGKINNVQLESSIADRLTECASSMTSGNNLLSFGANSAVHCANAVAQIALATQLNGLQNEVMGQDDVIAKEDFAGKAALHARALQQTSIQLGEAAENIRSASAAIDGLKKDAQVGLARAVYAASEQSKSQADEISALGTLATGKQIRYQNAFKNAQETTFIAKRAIEQRLGVQLSTMTNPLPLVDAPQTWEGELCTLSGIDYLKAVNGNVNNVTHGFIGDYVTKLSNLVESYRIQNNFHQGSDVAVISLRDDILNVRKKCPVPSSNLLAQSAPLDDTAWHATGCQAVSVGATSQPAMNCIAALPYLTPAPESPFSPYDTELSATMGYRLQFGDGHGCPSNGVAGPCGWHAGAEWVQSVTLAAGNYRLSWYTKESGAHGGNSAGVVTAPDGSSVATVYGMPVPGVAPTWNRASLTFRAQVAGVYQIGFGVPDTVLPSYAVTVAAPMLELVREDGQDLALRSFEKTGTDDTVQLAVCEDTDGSVFRATEWTRECVRLCDAGFSNDCTQGPIKCYRKATFGVDQSAIQNGKLFNFSGFARGNFNYRIDAMALNFVGTGIRNCGASMLPSACSGGGFATYSLDHTGPFYVRNFDGGDFRAYLFDGHIEQARGLATERYLSNPISETDRQLLADYERKEFEGRPLDGNFTIRIWEDDALNFDAIQDVQVILNYSYWTRFK